MVYTKHQNKTNTRNDSAKIVSVCIKRRTPNIVILKDFQIILARHKKLHFLMVVRPEFETIFQICVDTHEDICHTIDKTKCDYEEKEVCETVYQKSCTHQNKQECFTHYEKVCANSHVHQVFKIVPFSFLKLFHGKFYFIINPIKH